MSRDDRFGIRPVLDSERGITLLEVVVATAVFALGMLGIARMHVMSSQSDGRAGRMSEATMVAYDLLNYLQNVPFEQAPFLVPVGNAYPDFLDEHPASLAFRTIAPPEEDLFDYDDSVLPDAQVDADIETPCLGAACSPFVGLTASGDDPSVPGLRHRNLDNMPPEYERYWRLQWLDVQTQHGTGRALGIAVIVRWRDPGSRLFRRVVVFGNRYHPEDILP